MAYKSFGAIGNYIHVSSINYNKYGTNWSQNGEDGYRGDAAKIALFNKIIEERRTHQEPILNEEEKETVEFALSSLIGVNMDTMSGSLAD